MVRLLGVRRETPLRGSRDQLIAAIARHQRGRLARRQLLAAGISSGAIGRAVRGQRLVVEHRGVYRIPGCESVPLGAETAALLAVREGALLSHHSAAALWGLRSAGDHLIDVVVDGARAGEVAGVRVHRTQTLATVDRRVCSGLPVTSPERTIIDLAPALTDRQLEFILDQALTERRVREPALRSALERLTHALGRSRVLALLGDTTHATVTRSRAEERLLALIRAARLPEPLVNARLAGYEFDFYWPGAGLVVEVDGLQFHATRPRLERDRRKDDALRSVGVDPMRFTARQVERDAVATIVRIGQALALRSAT